MSKIIDKLVEGFFTAIGVYTGLWLLAKAFGLPLVISFG